MKISAWSIRNPVPVVAMFLCLAYAGAVGYSNLRVNSMPDIQFPTVTVSVAQKGASPSELEAQVTGRMAGLVQASVSARVGDRIVLQGDVTLSGK